MEIFDMLVLGVEAGIALAGFAGIIATFQFGGAEELRRADAVGLSMILQWSFFAVAVCSLVMLLIAFQVSESTIWAISSVFVCFVSAYPAIAANKLFQLSKRKKSFRFLIIFVEMITLILIFANLLNAADVVFHREPGPVLTVVVFGLGLSAFSFTRLLLIPAWRTVYASEAAASDVSA